MAYDHRHTIRGVERSLRRIRFEPRAAFEGELLWRLRRGGEQGADDLAKVSALGWMLAAVVILAVLIFLFWLRLLAVAPGLP